MSHYDCKRCDQRFDQCDCKPTQSEGVVEQLKWGIQDDYSVCQLWVHSPSILGLDHIGRMVKRGLFDTKELAVTACERLLKREIAALEDELAGKRMSLSRAKSQNSGMGLKPEVPMTGADLVKMIQDHDC